MKDHWAHLTGRKTHTRVQWNEKNGLPTSRRFITIACFVFPLPTCVPQKIVDTLVLVCQLLVQRFTTAIITGLKAQCCLTRQIGFCLMKGLPSVVYKARKRLAETQHDYPFSWMWLPIFKLLHCECSKSKRPLLKKRSHCWLDSIWANHGHRIVWSTFKFLPMQSMVRSRKCKD